MIRRLSVVALSIAMSLVWLTSPPSQAAGESWTIVDVMDVGCDNTSDYYYVDTHFGGLDGGSYWVHLETYSDGKIYGNEGYDAIQSDGDSAMWHVGNDFSYADADNKGTWPMTPGKPMKAVFKLERPKGTVLSSWTMVAKSCDSATLLYNGPTSADPDGDYKVAPTDKCPGLRAFTANGCPLRERSLTLRARYGPKRVTGQLLATGYPTLYAGRTVTIWKVRAGADKKIGTRTTSSTGKFKMRLGKGRYYATAPGLVVAAAGQVSADTSPVRKLR